MTIELVRLEELELAEQPVEAPPALVPKPSHTGGSAWRDPRYRNPWLTNPYAEGRSRAIVFGAVLLGAVGVGLPVLNHYVDVTDSARSLVGSTGSDAPSAPLGPSAPAAPAPAASAAPAAAVDRAVQNAAVTSVIPPLSWSTGMPVQRVVTPPPPVVPPGIPLDQRTESGLPAGTPTMPADENPSTTPDDGTTTPDDGTTTPDDGTTTPDDGTTTPDDGTGTPPAGGTTTPGGSEFEEEIGAINQEFADEAPAMANLDSGAIGG